MNINIIGHKIETEVPYLRKSKPTPKEETVRFALFVVGAVVGALVVLIASTGGIH